MILQQQQLQLEALVVVVILDPWMCRRRRLVPFLLVSAARSRPHSLHLALFSPSKFVKGSKCFHTSDRGLRLRPCFFLSATACPPVFSAGTCGSVFM